MDHFIFFILKKKKFFCKKSHFSIKLFARVTCLIHCNNCQPQLNKPAEGTDYRPKVKVMGNSDSKKKVKKTSNPRSTKAVQK